MIIKFVMKFLPICLPSGLTVAAPDAFGRIPGVLIPKHALIIPCLDSILNDPELFENPSVFNPDRFIDETGKLKGIENVLTFGLGK